LLEVVQKIGTEREPEESLLNQSQNVATVIDPTFNKNRIETTNSNNKPSISKKKGK
jgi:hypothetical protein